VLVKSLALVRGVGLRRLATRAGALLLVLAVGLVAPNLFSGTELVRLRNALSLGPELVLGQDWAPPSVPADFKREAVRPAPFFDSVARGLNLEAMPDDWARALAIGSHLLTGAPTLNGGPVQRNLQHTYEAIVQRGDGYCGDFVRVFTAIANAAGLVTRPLAFSFDGFGGHGHIWLEVWSPASGRWQLLDVFNNQFVVAEDGHVLGAFELKRALATSQHRLRLQRIDPRARSYDIEEKAWEYYSRGLHEWYMPWGNNVQTVDAHWSTRWFEGVSRALEQAVPIVSGIQPRVRILAEADNVAQREALVHVRQRLFAAAWAGVAGAALLVAAMLGRRRGAGVMQTPSTPGVLP